MLNVVSITRITIVLVRYALELYALFFFSYWKGFLILCSIYCPLSPVMFFLISCQKVFPVLSSLLCFGVAFFWCIIIFQTNFFCSSGETLWNIANSSVSVGWFVKFREWGLRQKSSGEYLHQFAGEKAINIESVQRHSSISWFVFVRFCC